CGSFDYATVFANTAAIEGQSFSPWDGVHWSIPTFICIGLFIGAMGKSAQVPLHVWLPDSMEGPTPISALIHAATMVTAGIFMVARMSPLFELSDTALNFVLIIGSITALFMGFLGVVQNDIKRVVAYSTLSQLGYMTVALGVSAYSIGIFHLMTHAAFKALLFLGAGSVIIGMHHDQDIRNMGGLRKYMPITWITFLLGSIALAGIPPLAGFFSKDSIIEAVHFSQLPGAGFAYFAVVASVFVTALYSFRLYVLVFHGPERFRHKPFPGEHDHADVEADTHGHAHVHVPHESPWVVTLPLVLLAILSVVLGWWGIQPLLYGGFFDGAIVVDAARHPAMQALAEEFHGASAMVLHALTTLPFWLSLAGTATAVLCCLWRPAIGDAIKARTGFINRLLDHKYYFDWFNENVIAAGARLLGRGLWRGADNGLIDGLLVNGSARAVGAVAMVVRQVQTGHLYWYALVMVLGVVGLMTWRLWPALSNLLPN
ncbi:MAG: NADH-quinone oxidoreductase subunit L, partial [Rubrivivax sp.]